MIGPMGQNPKKNCKVGSHQLLKDRAKNRVEDLHSMFTDLQFARKESRSGDVAILEEQMSLILREWKAELNEPTPASSLVEDSFGSLSDLGRLLEQFEEQDDATSALPENSEQLSFNPGLDVHVLQVEESPVFKEEDHSNYVSQGGKFQGFQQLEISAPDASNPLTTGVAITDLWHPVSHSNLNMPTLLGYDQTSQHHPGFENELFIYADNMEPICMEGVSDISSFFPSASPPPSAFLGPKCALWDCPRPVQGLEWCQDYCSDFHATLAAREGPPGMAPILRPNGIGLKDGPLFSAVKAKMEGKDVGIPECEGAATARSPWNAPELFDTSFIEGEMVREWLFFDKPRRAFECGNRKQRSLPDYNGRGWHESRKQVMKEYGGWKRSYYMDPQPVHDYEWHLFEYEVENCEGCALYRLELKLSDGKKSPKAKVMKDSLADLQKKMGRLTADASETKKSGKGNRGKGNVKSEQANAAAAALYTSANTSECCTHSDGSSVREPEILSVGDLTKSCGK